MMRLLPHLTILYQIYHHKNFLIMRIDKQDSIPQVYTIPEVAEILKCKTKTIEGHLYNARDLSYLKVGRQVRISEEDLREFLGNRLTPCVKVRSLK